MGHRGAWALREGGKDEYRGAVRRDFPWAQGGLPLEPQRTQLGLPRGAKAEVSLEERMRVSNRYARKRPQLQVLAELRCGAHPGRRKMWKGTPEPRGHEITPHSFHSLRHQRGVECKTELFGAQEIPRYSTSSSASGSRPHQERLLWS